MSDMKQTMSSIVEHVDAVLNEQASQDQRIAFAVVVFDTSGEQMEAYIGSNAPRDRITRALLEYSLAATAEMN